MTRRCLLRLLAATVYLGVLAGCGQADPRGQSPEAPPALAGTSGINRPEQQDKPYLILISFDAFRPDYLTRFDLPNFRRATERGTRSEAMVPVFPSLTFPNHYSLVTGLWTDRHGIVANTFYDPARRASYSLRDPAAVGDGSWYRGEPIWVTAETQGMVSACYFWPGSEAAIKGVRPTFWNKYDDGVPNEMRVKAVLDWLRLPADRRPHMITLYFAELDGTSHRHALDSPAVPRAAQSLDRALGALLDGIDALPIRDRVYLLLTSDHGMAETSMSQAIPLASLVSTAGIRAGYAGAITNLHVDGGPARVRVVYDRISGRLEHGRAYLRQELPERFHYRTDPRAGDIVIVMDEGWTVSNIPVATLLPGRWGRHGWDPALPSMKALFLLIGPGIPQGAVIPPVENVDVYPLMTDLLGLRPAEGIDGRAGAIRKLFP